MHDTTVMWADGTTTTVHCAAGEPYDQYNAFCAAVTKKLFGSTSAAKKAMDRASVVQSIPSALILSCGMSDDERAELVDSLLETLDTLSSIFRKFVPSKTPMPYEENIKRSPLVEACRLLRNDVAGDEWDDEQEDDWDDDWDEDNDDGWDGGIDDDGCAIDQSWFYRSIYGSMYDDGVEE